jgi:hypothetical protein
MTKAGGKYWQVHAAATGSFWGENTALLREKINQKQVFSGFFIQKVVAAISKKKKAIYKF